jgi:hypothetical protein
METPVVVVVWDVTAHSLVARWNLQAPSSIMGKKGREELFIYSNLVNTFQMII